MDVRYYNIAANLYSQLLKKGESCVAQHINSKIKKYREKISLTEISDLEKKLEICAQQIIGWKSIEFNSSENKIDTILNFFIILDYLSTDEWLNNIDLEGNILSLNNQYTEEIEIYATIPGIDRIGSSYDKIVCIFRNLIFFKKDTDFEKLLNVKNYYIRSDNIKDSFNIGFAPYPFDSELPYTIVGNKIKGIQKNELTQSDSKFLAVCDKLMTKYKCNLIFGPEMYGSPPLDKELKNLIKKNSLTSDINLVACPSFHRLVGEDGKTTINASTVYIRQKPHLKTAIVEKCFRADFSSNIQEDLTYNADEIRHNILLLHIHNIGRVLVLICKDFITEALNALIEKLNVDIIIIQCFSDNLTAFHHYAEKVIRKRIIILGNSCHAAKIISTGRECLQHPLVLYEYNYEHGRSGQPMNTSTFECKGKCDYSCEVCGKVLKVKKVLNPKQAGINMFNVEIVSLQNGGVNL